MVIDANNFGNENSWIISDMDGTALYWKFGLTSNQYNIDTVNLPNGCYLFELTDNGKDGLDFGGVMLLPEQDQQSSNKYSLHIS